jgi:hypothetical protein
MLDFHDLSRRDFLGATSLAAGAVGLSLADALAASSSKDMRCIFLFLVGGPSQLDTWDLKPSAPANVRGPFSPIRTSVPGISIAETFPRMAKLAHHVAFVRSMHHEAAPIHETGHQLLQTGKLFREGKEAPHFGSLVSATHGRATPEAAAFVVLPKPIGYTGVSVSHGQTAGPLGASHEPLFRDVAKLPLDERYGNSTFGRACHTARRLIEQGTRFVTVNMFDTVFNETTWDCHADGGSLASSLEDYRDSLCPMFDLAYSALLEDLHMRGLLKNTLVVATGEFGRTPHLNCAGGRDHWPGVWTALFAGGPVKGGQVIGSSDRLGAEPKDRAIDPGQLAATMGSILGIETGSTSEPVKELLG